MNHFSGTEKFIFPAIQKQSFWDFSKIIYGQNNAFQFFCVVGSLDPKIHNPE
jgi:hypothetical protein